MARLEEIETRLSAIKQEIETEGADLIALGKETDELLEERKGLLDAIEVRKATLSKIANGETITEKEEIVKMEEKRTFALDSAEYRGAFLKNVIGKELTAEERSALSMNGNIAYTQMQQSVIAKVKEYAPVANEVTMLSVPGYVKFAVEGVSADAKDHTENAKITPDSDTFVSVELNPTEITKMIQISDSVAQMSIDGLESFIIENISRAIAALIEKKIITAMATAATQVATVIDTPNVYKLFGSIKAGYAREAVVYCNRTTLYGSLLGLQDKSKNDLVVREGNTYKLLGVTVEETPSLADGVVVLGAPKKVVADLAETVSVKKGFDIDTNSYKFLGVALFDCKVAIAEAFAKIEVTL